VHSTTLHVNGVHIAVLPVLQTSESTGLRISPFFPPSRALKPNSRKASKFRSNQFHRPFFRLENNVLTHAFTSVLPRVSVSSPSKRSILTPSNSAVGGKVDCSYAKYAYLQMIHGGHFHVRP
ncbi:unnamed protein product, partial [Sphacelaria rigidula]